MGRHHVKLPDHLYLSPPSPQPTSTLTTAVSLLSLKSGAYTSPAALIQETSSTALAVRDKIPGFKTSAAFLTTLRANINLELEYPDSITNTPDSLRPKSDMASSISSLPEKDKLLNADAAFAPPAALNLPRPTLSDDAPEADPSQPSDPNEIPPLTTFLATDDKNRIEALRLVADSVAQQRQRASRLLIFHPGTIAVLLALFAAVYQYFPHEKWGDFAIMLTTCSGIVMTMFVSVRALAGGYIEEAERVGTWRWLDYGTKESEQEATGKKVMGPDEILITKFGQEYIGAAVFRGVTNSHDPAARSSTSGSKKHKKSNSGDSSNVPRTEIRAWTVRQKYRHKGVGTALLEETIRISGQKGWLAGGIDFASDHANSKRVLPNMFNGELDTNERNARDLLAQKVREFDQGQTQTQTQTHNDNGKKNKRRR